MEQRLGKTNPGVTTQIGVPPEDIGRGEAALASRPAGPLPGPILLWIAMREERRLARWVTCRLVDRRNWTLARAQSKVAGILSDDSTR